MGWGCALQAPFPRHSSHFGSDKFPLDSQLTTPPLCKAAPAGRFPFRRGPAHAATQPSFKGSRHLLSCNFHFCKLPITYRRGQDPEHSLELLCLPQAPLAGAWPRAARTGNTTSTLTSDSVPAAVSELPFFFPTYRSVPGTLLQSSLFHRPSAVSQSTNHQEFLHYRFVFVPVGLSEAVPAPGCCSYPTQERAAGEVPVTTAL